MTLCWLSIGIQALSCHDKYSRLSCPNNHSNIRNSKSYTQPEAYKHNMHNYKLKFWLCNKSHYISKQIHLVGECFILKFIKTQPVFWWRSLIETEMSTKWENWLFWRNLIWNHTVLVQFHIMSIIHFSDVVMTWFCEQNLVM